MQSTIRSTEDGGNLQKSTYLTDVFDGRINLCNMIHVYSGLKPVTRFLLTHDNIETVRKVLDRMGLKMYSSPLNTTVDGVVKRMVYISKRETDALAAYAAELKGDHKLLGWLLGYPSCCVNFFIENYHEASKMYDDYTLMTLDNSDGTEFSRCTNISLRYFDVSLLSHFPCSFDCSHSLELAKRYAECIRRCAPHLYDEIISELGTAVVYSNDTGVHAFKDVEYTSNGFTYGDVRVTTHNGFHELLKKGNYIEVRDEHHFLIYKYQQMIKEINDRHMGVLQFR